MSFWEDVMRRVGKGTALAPEVSHGYPKPGEPTGIPTEQPDSVSYEPDPELRARMAQEDAAAVLPAGGWKAQQFGPAADLRPGGVPATLPAEGLWASTTPDTYEPDPDLQRKGGDSDGVRGAAGRMAMGAALTPQAPAPRRTVQVGMGAPTPDYSATHGFRSLAGLAPGGQGGAAGPGAAGAPPPAGPGGPGDPELAAAQQRARSLNLVAGLSRVGSRTAQALSRGAYQPDEQAGDELRQQAAQQVPQVLQARVQAAQAHMQAQKAAEQDPASPISRAHQDAIRRTMPDVAAQLGPALEHLPAASAKDVQSLAEFVARQKQSGEEKTRALAEKEREFGEREKDRQAQLQIGRMGLANRNEMAAARLESLRQLEDIRGKQEARREGQINPGDGYELEPGRQLTAKQAQDLAGLHATHEMLSDALGQYRDLIAKTGGTVLPTADQGRAQALYNRIVPLVGQMEQTGALTQGHQGLITQQLPKPGEWKTIVNPGRTLAVIDQLKGEMDTGLAAKQRAYGVRPRAGAATGGGKITVTNGKETLQIDPADEAEAARDGFRRAG